MRTIALLSLLLLVVCVGCPNVSYKEKPTAKSAETQEPEKSQGYVEPMFLPDGTKVGDPAAPGESAAPTEETTTIPSTTLGKYAAEAVPLPPVEDLTAQVDEYIIKIGRSLEDLDGSPKYADDAVAVVRDANALALVALAIGLAESDSKYKKQASQIVTAAKTLAAAKSLDEGEKAYAALKASQTGSGGGRPLSWTDKVADLKPLMKAVPNLNSAVKRLTDTERKLNTILSGANSQRVYGQLAALAVISQGSIPNVSETPKPEATEEWKQLCEEFRDLALKTNAAAHQYAKDKADGKEPDYSIFTTSYRAMTGSCDNCHKVFYPSAIGKE